MSWQSSLATSAVSAAEDVRSTVRAARVAANAKAAADSAALAAQSVCDGTRFNSIDEARAAQTRASIAQSQAIHAAVVEHGANRAKRSGAMALAHDVKSWNMHRKRELLSSCLAMARSQHRAASKAVDAWSALSDGYLGSTVVPYAEEEQQAVNVDVLADTNPSRPQEQERQLPSNTFLRPVKPKVVQEFQHEASSQIYSEVSPHMESAIGAPTIRAVDHLVLSSSSTADSDEKETNDTVVTAMPFAFSENVGSHDPKTERMHDPFGELGETRVGQSLDYPPHNTEDHDTDDSPDQENGEQSLNTPEASPPSFPKLLVAIDERGEEPQDLTDKEDSGHDSKRVEPLLDMDAFTDALDANIIGNDSSADVVSKSHDVPALSTEDNPLSESMQSLVDGLMTWGSQYDSQELHSGLAASIVLDTSNDVN